MTAFLLDLGFRLRGGQTRAFSRSIELPLEPFPGLVIRLFKANSDLKRSVEQITVDPFIEGEAEPELDLGSLVEEETDPETFQLYLKLCEEEWNDRG